MRRTIWLAAALLVMGCVEATTEEPAVEAATVATVTHEQPVLDEGPNWLVAGGQGLVELVGGTDGEPDVTTGRFVLEGERVNDAASAHGKWVVAGNGVTQPLDGDAVRLHEMRTALGGGAISFVEPAPDGFVIGGAAGMLQQLDTEGEPTTTDVTVLDGTTLTAAAFSGTSWLVGGENGSLVVVNASLDAPANPSGVVADGGKPIVAITYNGTGWEAFTADSTIAVSPLGTASPPAPMPPGVRITDARFHDGTTYVATDDGRVGLRRGGIVVFGSMLPGESIVKLVSNGAHWIALGKTGSVRLFDKDAQPISDVVEVTTFGHAITGAYFDAADNQWLIVDGSIGLVHFADAQLGELRTLTPLLDGTLLGVASVGDPNVLIAGGNGLVQIIDKRGAPVTAPKTAPVGTIRAAAWNGTSWLVGGTDGRAQVLGPDASPMGEPQTLLDGADIGFASWSGEYWLVGGEGGAFQFVRFDGTAAGPVRILPDVDLLHDAQWSGVDWMVVGEFDDEGIAALIDDDPNAEPTVQVLPAGALFAVEFNGIEWLAGGADGFIQRLSAQGLPIASPVNVLAGFDIFDMHFNGTIYAVAGESGATRRLGHDYVPLRAPLAMLNGNQIDSVVWTTPRGFAGGTCLTDELCFQGPCVGGITSGKCCDSACIGGCESCFEADTGEPDGTCAPVAAGRRPPIKPDQSDDPCPRQSESSCGTTGLCDGAGACEFWGSEIQCGDAVCTLGEFTPVAFCGGDGTCATSGAVDCSPYKGCDADGCLDSCNSDQDCVAGFVCEDSACVEPDEGEGEGEGDAGGGPGPGSDAPDETGCCATAASPVDARGAWLALILTGLLIARRPSR